MTPGHIAQVTILFLVSAPLLGAIIAGVVIQLLSERPPKLESDEKQRKRWNR